MPSSAFAVLSSQIHPSPLKRAMSIIPSSPQPCGSEWPSQEDLGGRPGFLPQDHAPLSPQSSVASSGSEQTEDQGAARNTFQEEGSGMKGEGGDLHSRVVTTDHCVSARWRQSGSERPAGVRQEVSALLASDRK